MIVQTVRIIIEAIIAKLKIENEKYSGVQNDKNINLAKPIENCYQSASFNFYNIYMSHCISKPTKCFGENKGADQLL